jgi:hypothetical protein
MSFPKSMKTSRKTEATTALKSSSRCKTIPPLTPNLNLITQLDDLRRDYIEHFTMAWTKTRLASFLAFITLSTISPAGAFSGKFEICDLCVDSPFQVDVTSTVNSTVSCTSCSLSIILSHYPCFKVSLNQHRPAQVLPSLPVAIQFDGAH